MTVPFRSEESGYYFKGIPAFLFPSIGKCLLRTF